MTKCNSILSEISDVKWCPKCKSMKTNFSMISGTNRESNICDDCVATYRASKRKKDAAIVSIRASHDCNNCKYANVELEDNSVCAECLDSADKDKYEGIK